MTQGSCKLTVDHVAKVRQAILEFRAADDRNYNDKERPLQLAEDLMNALLAQLFDVEPVVSAAPEGQSLHGPEDKGLSGGVEGHFSEAVQAFTEHKLLKLEADKRLAQGDAAALLHLRPKESA
jgi:hypothetical protein